MSVVPPRAGEGALRFHLGCSLTGAAGAGSLTGCLRVPERVGYRAAAAARTDITYQSPNIRTACARRHRAR